MMAVGTGQGADRTIAAAALPFGRLFGRHVGGDHVYACAKNLQCGRATAPLSPFRDLDLFVVDDGFLAPSFA